MGDLAQGMVDSKKILETVGQRSVQRNRRWGRTADDFFIGSVEADTVHSYWSASGFTNPLGKTPIIYSRRQFSYPVAAVNATFPALSAVAPNRSIMLFGFEDGNVGRTCDCWLGTVHGDMRIVGVTSNGRIDLNLPNNREPADLATVKHSYHVKLNRMNFEAYIDNVLVGIVLAGVPSGMSPSIGGPAIAPYVIGGASGAAITSNVSLLLGNEGPDNALTQFTLGIGGWNDAGLWVGDGDPCPPRSFAVYTESTVDNWTGLVLGDGDPIASHPIPIWGYTTKQVFFKAGASGGSLSVQGYIEGAWRDLNTTAVGANAETSYAITQPLAVIRLYYDPAAAETIAYAKVMMH